MAWQDAEAIQHTKDMDNHTRVRVYIDGLNFYYGVARKYNIKWIDIEKLMYRLLEPKIDGDITIEKIFIFTARFYGKGTSMDARQRQTAYLAALQKHSPCIKLILGVFKKRTKQGKLIDGEPNLMQSYKGSIVKIKTREDKHTDVNLACKMVDDAHTTRGQKFDLSCLVCNDSDVAYALKVKNRLNQRTILVTPKLAKEYSASSSGDIEHLIPKEDRILNIQKSLVQKCRLPDQVDTITAPNSSGWSA